MVGPGGQKKNAKKPRRDWCSACVQQAKGSVGAKQSRDLAALIGSSAADKSRKKKVRLHELQNEKQHAEDCVAALEVEKRELQLSTKAQSTKLLVLGKKLLNRERNVELLKNELSESNEAMQDLADEAAGNAKEAEEAREEAGEARQEAEEAKEEAEEAREEAEEAREEAEEAREKAEETRKKAEAREKAEEARTATAIAEAVTEAEKKLKDIRRRYGDFKERCGIPRKRGIPGIDNGMTERMTAAWASERTRIVNHLKAPLIGRNLQDIALAIKKSGINIPALCGTPEFDRPKGTRLVHDAP